MSTHEDLPPIERVLCFLEQADDALIDFDRKADPDGYYTLEAAIGQAIGVAREIRKCRCMRLREKQ